MRKLLLLAAAFAACVPAADSWKANDGKHHGDPPFLLESGWKPLLNGRDLSNWVGREGKPHNWVTTRAIWWDPANPKALQAAKEPGDRILNGNGITADLLTKEKFGDAEVYVEFLIPQGSNSGVYLQGLYEVQIYDSHGMANPNTSAGGAIYHRWIDEKPVGGAAPRVNAQGRPGEWQSYHVWFRAPRFDAGGKKTENARFLRVLHNGQLVHEDVEVDGPTRAHADMPEAALNPLMLQGDHGPVAFRNIYIRPLRAQ